MPVYLAHGFRWPRAGFTGVRVHIIFHNLEDCSAEYIQNAHSQASILASFRQTWPDLMKELDDEAHGGRGRGLTLLEEYDPEDEVSELAVSRPWAFVCDCVRVLPMGKDGALDETARGAEAAGKGKAVEGKEGAAATASVLKGPTLSMNVTELIAQGPGSTPKAWEALADLRDKIADGEKIDWWVIYNGDPERAYSVTDESEYEDEESEDTGVAEGHGEQIPEVHQPSRKTLVPQEEAVRRPSPARPPQPEERLEQRPKSSSKSKGIMLPPIPPAKDRDKGKRTPGMTAFPPLDKAMPPLPPLPSLPTPAPVLKSPAKTESGLKKKLFGKK